MTPAKRNAFLEGIEKGKFDNYRAMVYNLVSRGHAKTLGELMDQGVPEKTASGRISELMDMGLIKADGEKNSTFTVVTDPTEMDKLMLERSSEKYEQWFKRGVENGYFERAKV